MFGRVISAVQDETHALNATITKTTDLFLILVALYLVQCLPCLGKKPSLGFQWISRFLVHSPALLMSGVRNGQGRKGLETVRGCLEGDVVCRRALKRHVGRERRETKGRRASRNVVPWVAG